MKRGSQGFALITAAIVLLVAASVALMLTHEVSMGQRLLASDGERADMRYLVEAGFAHADWQLAQNDTCTNFVPVTGGSFNGHTYNASFNPDAGSPVEVILTAKHGDGVTQVVSRERVKAYQSPSQTTLQPGSADGVDAYIWRTYADDEYGAEDETWVSCCGNNTSKSLLQFDLSELTAGARIKGATLSMYHRSGSYPRVPVTAHRVTNPWNEAEVNWNDRERNTRWDTAGGDYDAAIIASTEVGPVSGVRYEWDVSELVNAWHTGALPNYGVLLATTTPFVSGERFDTSDHADPTRRPSLRIDLACECGVACVSDGASNLLVVVQSPASLLPQEAQKRALIESWGYVVELIDDDASGGDFDDAVARNGVVFVSSTADYASLSGELDDAAIGVVFELHDLADDFGLADDVADGPLTSDMEVVNNSHYITSPFSVGPLSLFASAQETRLIQGALASDLLTLGEASGNKVLNTLEQGATQVDATPSPGRRVKLPWGSASFSPDSLSVEGELLMQRAIEWGAGEGNNLVGHWMLDDASGTAAVDSSGRGNHGTLNGGPTWTTGVIAGALSFDDATNDRIVVPDDESLDLSTSLTLAAWIRPTAAASQFIIQKGELNVTDGYELSLGSSGKIIFRLNQRSDGNLYRVVSTSSYPTDGATWMHVAGTFDGSTIRIWVNGVAEDSAPAVTTIDTNDIDLSIGGQVDGTRVLDGLIDDARVYGNALDAAAIAELATVDTGMLAHWKLDDAVGTTALDSVGGHDGTLVNPPLWVSGQVDGGLDFDGVDDYVDLGSDTELIDVFDGGATVMGWIYPRSWGESDNGRILDKASQISGDRDGWMIGVVGSGRNALQFAQGFTGVRGFWRSEANTLNLNAWTHFAVVYDAGSVANDAEIYLNGILQSPLVEITPTGSIATDAGISMRMGSYAQDTSRTFDGVIDDVRIYDRMLGAAEVADIATAGAGGGGPSGGGLYCTSSYGDDFETDDYSGSTGDQLWSGSWTEVNETTNPGAGDEQVLSQPNGNFVVRIRDNDGGGEGILRAADLAGFTSAVLSFDYWRDALDDASDYVAVEILPDGAGSWQEVTRIEGPGTDVNTGPPQTESADISSFITSNTQVRFVTSPTMGPQDELYLDNVQICLN